MTFSNIQIPEMLKAHAKKLFVASVLYFLGLLGFSILVPILGLIGYLSWLYFNPGDEVPSRPEEKHEDFEIEDEEQSEWTTQPGVERTEWINEIILKVWPGTEKRILAEIENVLAGEESKSNLNVLGVGEIKLIKFQLGDIPPRLGGVKIQGVSLDELILDSDLSYIGNSRIEFTLGINKFSQSIALAVENFTLSGKFRIICKPLLNHTPFVGGVRFSFLNIPEIDFEPIGLLSVLDLPGLRHFIHSRITNQIQEYLMFPRGITLPVPSSEKKKHFPKTDKFELPNGVFSLCLVEAKDLRNTDLTFLKKGVSDPYGTLSFSVDGKEHNFRTEIIKNCLDPKWNFHKLFFVDDPKTFSEINICIRDKDTYGADDLLGVSCVYKDVVSQVIRRETTYDYWKMLEKTDQGSVRVRVSWSRFDISPPRNTDDQAVVVVYLDSCRNIFGTETRKPDTKIKISIGPQSCVSQTVFSCKNPIYDERLIIFSNNPTNDDILFELLDAKDDSLLGSIMIELTQILSQENLILDNKEFTLNSSRIHGIRLRLSLALRFLQSEQFILPENHLMDKSLEEGHVFETHPSLGSIEIIEDLSQPEQIGFIDEGSEQDWRKINGTNDITSGSSEPALRGNSLSERNISLEEEKKYNEDFQPFRRSNTLPLQKVSGVKGLERLPSVMKRKTTKVITGAKVLLTLKFNKATSVLSIVIHKAVNLQEISQVPLPSPYLKCYLVESSFGRNRRDNYSKKKTKVKKNTVNPVYEETLEYCVPHFHLKTQKVEIILSSRKTVMSKSITLGRSLLNLSSLQSQPSLTLWTPFRLSEEKDSVTSLSRTSSGSFNQHQTISQSSLPS